jgi:glycosyltransferase involved in cell wall biosynthesis
MMPPPGATEGIRISVVIPTYQRCASVRRTLEALARQTMAPSEYEVIVPIDGSDDGTKEMVEHFQAPYRLSATWHPNQGRAAARNAGLRLAQGHLIVFLDDDMEPVPGFLLAHVEAHPSGSRRAVIGPVPIPVDASSPPLLRYRSSGMDAHLGRLAQAGYRLGFRDMYSGNLSMPCDVLREVGGFDETFTLYGHEDYELALPLAKPGVELGSAPLATAYQHDEKDFAGLARDCVARGHTAVLFARKHPDVASSPQLAGYRTGSLGWRLVRSVMLTCGQWVPRFPEWVIGAMTGLERREPRRLPGLYRRSLDYFFWVGARAALREPRRPDLQRMRIGLCVLALFAAGSSLRLAARKAHELRHVRGPDEITRYEARFHELRRAVPPYARSRYVTDATPPWPADDDEGPRLAFKRYLLTQYALLPAIVLPGSHGGLAVGNFESPNGADSGATSHRTLVRDFGDGVMLFRTSPE